MKIVIPGGTGQVGAVLNRALSSAGHEIVVLTRRPTRGGEVHWDGETLGPWAAAIDGSDVVINLAGRSVSCRYTAPNLQAMMDSRVHSTQVVGEAIASAVRPPRVWLQMSTATIYAHRFDAPNDEATGIIGGSEPDVPDYWAYSIDIARSWERAQEEADTPHTRKVALRSAMVMSPDRGGVLDILLRLARLGLGGPVAGGGQYISWIHDRDFVRAVEFLIEREDLIGPVNMAAPNRSRNARSCGAFAPRRASPWACPRRGGWRRSVRSHCARTPSCCSRAAASSPAGCSTRGSPSSTPAGRKRPTISYGACGSAGSTGAGPGPESRH